MDEDRAWIAHQIKAAREARGLTQKALGELAGVAGNTVVAVEAGRPVRASNLVKIREALRIDLQGSSGGPRVEAGEAMARAFLRSADDPADADRRLAHLAAAVATYRPTPK